MKLIITLYQFQPKNPREKLLGENHNSV